MYVPDALSKVSVPCPAVAGPVVVLLGVELEEVVEPGWPVVDGAPVFEVEVGVHAEITTRRSSAVARAALRTIFDSLIALKTPPFMSRVWW